MYDGMGFIHRPFKKFFGIKPFEQVSFTGEERVERGDGQRFSESPGA
jgi:hypothetical protein